MQIYLRFRSSRDKLPAGNPSKDSKYFVINLQKVLQIPQKRGGGARADTSLLPDKLTLRGCLQGGEWSLQRLVAASGQGGVALVRGVAAARASGGELRGFGVLRERNGAVREIHRASECALQGLLRPIGSRGEFHEARKAAPAADEMSAGAISGGCQRWMRRGEAAFSEGCRRRMLRGQGLSERVGELGAATMKCIAGR